MPNDWAPEPWVYVDCELFTGASDTNGKSLFHPCYSETGENIERAIACVNACAGVPTEDLGFGIVAMHNEKTDELLQKFDEILRKGDKLKEATDGRDDTVSGD